MGVPQMLQDRPIWEGDGGVPRHYLCLVEAVHAYVARRGTVPGSFFCMEGGAPLTKSRFVELVRAALIRAGVSVAG